MAKVTITIEDDGDGVTLVADFDPKISGDKVTNAQLLACSAVEYVCALIQQATGETVELRGELDSHAARSMRAALDESN